MWPHDQDVQVSSTTGAGDACRSKRACIGCNRKKTKCSYSGSVEHHLPCDMTLPSCNLCSRTNTPCLYPSHGKKRTLKLQLQHRANQCNGAIQQCDQTSDIVSAQKQGHHGHQLESTTTDDPNTEDNILTESSSTAMSDLGNVHALTQSASFDDRYLNRINSIDPLMDFELGRLETPKQNAVLDNLSTPWNSVYFWHAYSPGMSSWNPGPDQVSPESSGEGAVDSSNNTLHTPGPSTAAGISGALVEELFHEQYFSGNLSIPDDDAARLLRDSLLVNAILALAARFSSAPYFNQKPNVDKGEEFAESAKDIYYYCLQAAQKNTLKFLQGCTLLAFQLYLHGPTTER
ncbi:hypothetical protein FOVSG1_013591 [Fusarium oxysporum f. sp. vasinfectum]